MAVILYHHTDPAYLPSILEHGLIARPWCGDDDSDRALLSAVLHNRPVVWLTTQSSTAFTEDDIAFLRQQRRDDEAATGMWMSRNGGDLLRLRIDVPKHSKKLFHFRSWVQSHEAVIIHEDGKARCNDDGELLTTASFLVGNDFPYVAQWYIHFGDIPPKRITLLPTDKEIAA